MKKFTLLLLTILLFAFNSCKKDDEIEPINDNGLAENTVQITDSDWQNTIINIDTTTYTFKFKKNVLDNYSINKGDIILGTEDGGYLRKVKNMTSVGDEITVETEFAAITEAFKDLHEQTSVTIMPNIESQEFWLDDGVEMSSLKSTSANLMNFSINTVLYDLDGDLSPSSSTDQIRISGSYKLDADFNIDLDIENFEVSKLMLQYDINQTKVIDGYLGLPGLEYSLKKRIAKIPCGTIAAGPVIIEPVIEIYAGFNVDMSMPLQMKIEQEYNSLTTITYENGNWDTEKTVTENESFEKPTISGVLDAKLYLKPVLKFKVYRTVSPYIDVELYGAANVELEFDLLKWKTSVGFDMNAGVSMMIWNHSLFNFNTNLFHWEHIIAQGEESGQSQSNFDNFESYNAGSFPSSWVADANANNISNNYIDNTIKYEGDKSLKIYGSVGGCWGALAYKPMDFNSSFTIELAIRNGDENLSGCHPDRGQIGLRKGTSWSNPARRLLLFGGDGKIYGGSSTSLGTYNTNTWYLVKIKYEKTADSQIKLSYWINNDYLGEETFDSIADENLLDNFEIVAQEGSAWFDAISFYPDSN
ncbi:MAG: hypothetical protein GQ564_22595 [Bacteroidales bacterium]|nr:hypothetical protein [Bacteroidales bacterium]